MKVILNVNAPKPYIQGSVQVCNTVEGFMSIKEMHPEDEFDVDLNSYEVYMAYMTDLAMREVADFLDEMMISSEDFSAMLTYYSCSAYVLAPVYEEEENG